jgi:hypothetical protein
MSTASNQEAMKKYERANDHLIEENKQSAEAIFNKNISKMD